MYWARIATGTPTVDKEFLIELKAVNSHISHMYMEGGEGEGEGKEWTMLSVRMEKPKP